MIHDQFSRTTKIARHVGVTSTNTNSGLPVTQRLRYINNNCSRRPNNLSLKTARAFLQDTLGGAYGLTNLQNSRLTRKNSVTGPTTPFYKLGCINAMHSGGGIVRALSSLAWSSMV